MKRNLINTPLFALFAGAFLFESGTAFASSPVITLYVKDCGMGEKKEGKENKNVLQCPMC